MRRACFIAGLLVLGAVWGWPWSDASLGPFSRHMTIHMGVVAVAAPLLSLGISGSRWDPTMRAPRLFAPIPASLVELVVVWAWHAPALHLAARHAPAGWLVEQAAFFSSGMLVWLSALGRERPHGDRMAAGIVALLLTSMHMTLLGALLALAPRPLYAHGHAAHAGVDALGDQHLGGAIMLLVGGVAYLAGGVGLSAALLTTRRAPVLSSRAAAARALMAVDREGSSRS